MSQQFSEDDVPRLSYRRPPSAAGRLALLGLLLIGGGIAAAWMVYTEFRIDVPTAQMAILVHKTGLDLNNSEEAAMSAEYKGVQADVLTEGRHFRNPYYWAWTVEPQTEVPPGKVGVLTRLVGDELPAGEFLATSTKEKGIVPGVKLPGRYPINTYFYRIEMVDPVTIDAGYQGVVSNLAGPLAEDPNVLLVSDGKRGTQAKTLHEGTHLINPYEQQVHKVDCRSQRFNLAAEKDFGFPSKDGYWVTMDAVVEFRIDPKKVASVYVTYNDEKNGDAIDEEIISEIILPNARSICRLEGSSILGKDFIGSRKGFQEKFQKDLSKQCALSGIEIVQALITKIVPPAQIALPIQEREIAKQTEKQYQQQLLQQAAEKRQKVQKQLVSQKQAIVGAEQEVVKITTEAMQQQEVAVTKANEKLAVAELKLEAAKDQAEAILSLGEGAAEVLMFKNEAEAAGWKRSVTAFDGSGAKFAQNVLYQKISAAYREVMVNTADSPLMKIFETFQTK